MMTKPMAKVRKIGMTMSARNSIIVFITDEDSVATEPTAATVEFLINAIKVLPNGTIAPRKACGKITKRAAAGS